MERLRYVARAGSGDTALIVGETVEAIARLRPGPAELVTLCRQLVQRNPTCGPLWWLGSRLLSGDVEDLWDLVEEVDEDPTADHLVDAVPDGSRVLTIGCPDIASRALARRGDIEVLAVDAGAGAAAFMRALDRADVPVRSVDVIALPSAAACADLVVVEVAACSTAVGLAAVGNALLSVVAAATAAPRVVVTGVGTRLPDAYVDTIVARSIDPDAPWSADVERIDLTVFDADRDLVVGPAGAGPVGAETLRPDCPFVPELIPPSPA